jgi:hypothetical protein
MAHSARVPLLPVVLLLIAALAVFYPVISQLFPLLDYAPPGQGRRAPESQAAVWVNRRSGFYYCRESAMYGKLQPGRKMVQREALAEGYSPAEGKRCK